jgi:hypothetical protein
VRDLSRRTHCDRVRFGARERFLCAKADGLQSSTKTGPEVVTLVVGRSEWLSIRGSVVNFNIALLRPIAAGTTITCQDGGCLAMLTGTGSIESCRCAPQVTISLSFFVRSILLGFTHHPSQDSGRRSSTNSCQSMDRIEVS